MSETAENVLSKIEPVLVGIEGAASMLGISPTAFKALERAGQIGPLPIELGTCRRRLYCVAELRRWAEAGCPTREKWQAMKNESFFQKVGK
jgi:hypothetical protein